MSECIGRRAFVRRLPVVGSGILLGASTLTVAGCAGVPYANAREESGRLVVSVEELDREGSLFVQNPRMERPLFLHRAADGTAVAVLASCTHNGCQPEPVAGRLVCPCHGSEFTLAGAVLQGPAERPLPAYPVEEAGGTLTIALTGGGA